jgi:hypothetical protein
MVTSGAIFKAVFHFFSAIICQKDFFDEDSVISVEK